jgi:hypothetical protein
VTPTYDKLVAKLAELRERRGDRPIHPVESALLRAHSKAITSGQRAGSRAVANVFRPYEYEPYGSYDHGTVMRRADEAARIASARARERYVVKLADGLGLN